MQKLISFYCWFKTAIPKSRAIVRGRQKPVLNDDETPPLLN